MPNTLLAAHSNFDRSKGLLSSWLRQNLSSVVALTKDSLNLYREGRFIAGWSGNVVVDEKVLAFHILIDSKFPYSAIRLAYKSENVYTKWPHVDDVTGLLCLPKKNAPNGDVHAAIYSSFFEAMVLIEKCQNPDFLKEEFRREFLSYWERRENIAEDSIPIRSLLDLNNTNSRTIQVWRGAKYTLVGETKEQVCSWLQNIGFKGEPTLERGIFGFLAEAPYPPFPQNPNQLFSLLSRCTKSIDALLSGCQHTTRSLFVLAANSPTGVGVIAMQLSAVTKSKLKGFRKKTKLSSASKKIIWNKYSELKCLAVERYEAKWVHGRDLDPHHKLVQQAHILVLGCGSLGSQVAIRLAQAGVGNLTLVDPELLVPANVGRHALGIDSVNKSKAHELAKHIRSRFPHVSHAQGFRMPWQTYFERTVGFDSDVNVLVSCLGEWPADGQLAEWYARTKPTYPIAFGWLDEHGTAAHAIALNNSTPSLFCILNENGNLRIPETLWKSDREKQAEPACGTLFQPYGPLDLANAEILVARLCLDILKGSASFPSHRIYAGSTEDIQQAGGEWSATHLQNRPAEYQGPFEYSRSVPYCGQCPVCAEKS
ncbi:ThiF family adenylyltransferase [Cellvibrio sp. KY-YJ-3]|uniref:ThiF family adenylyltransferase n=1 Tax=Cellvibrio sp. KY-YJ-3 TaxID=454662 RepID=UPI001245F694|nr:ThiF family adenylyltransferase [Cellvibrio sp. KY-YJ-3]QEY13281.1 hypothetical protein D0B88_14120 [Cellvibrio sp. KY-YJ-3]